MNTELRWFSASWDSPPRRGEPGYEAFATAFKRYVHGRTVQVPIHDKKYIATFENRPLDEFRRKHALRDPAGLDLGQDPSLKLMPFQVSKGLYNHGMVVDPCIGGWLQLVVQQLVEPPALHLG